MQTTRSDFVQVIAEKKLFTEYLNYCKSDQTQTDRILFYETFEFLQELLDKEMPEFMSKRRESKGFPIAQFLGVHQSTKVDDAFIPSHLLHHVTRIYDFYFGSEAPVDIKLDQELVYEIKADYFSKQIPVNWLDQATCQVLEELYSKFHGFVDAQNRLNHSKKSMPKLANRASSLYSMLFQNELVSPRSSIYSNYYASHASYDSWVSSSEILDKYGRDQTESSDLVTTLSPAWESDKEEMKIEMINRNSSSRVLSKTTRQLYLDSSGLCLYNSASM